MVIWMVASGIAATYVFFWALLHLPQDQSERQLVSTRILFISPLLGMIQWSMDCYSFMRKRYRDLPIYTMRIPGSRLFVVNSLDLIPVVQRHWRTLIFAPVQIKAAQAAMGVSKRTIAVMERDMVTEAGFVNGMIKTTHPTVSNGPGLDALNAKAFEVFDNILRELNTPTTVSLFKWIDQQIMRATTDAVYGPQNPMCDDTNLDAWHNCHPAIMFLMLDILPSTISFKSATRVREHLIKSFSKYYEGGSFHARKQCNCYDTAPPIDVCREGIRDSAIQGLSHILG
ncbi:hypothetical protein JX265_009823 [Neoarthrinium moseri]|uniref:Cytochrome P450 n=1 Tax=Neoarthrinium moseri TaxID=1658444 RepID=A0A9P9WF33_9PEZI|nr:hypothetical protein JX265_009823 [Neoarthrinium moseri]